MASRAKIAAGAFAALGLTAAGAAVAATKRWAKTDDPTGGQPLAVPAGDTSTLTTADGTELAVLVAGSGEAGTVVLSHCWTGDHRVWGPVAQRLVDGGHRVVLYDQRGHGSSSVGSSGLTIEALADDLKAVIEHADARDAVIAGHSMGGMSAQAFAIHHPDVLAERVRGLALVATSSGQLGVSAMQSRIVRAVLSSGLTVRLLDRATLGPVLLRGSVGRQVALSHLQGVRDTFVGTPAVTRAGMFLAMSEMDLTGGLPKVDVPVRILVGTRDTLTPVAHARRMAELLPHAELEIIPDAGHMLPWEQPDRVAAVISELAGAPVAAPEAEIRSVAAPVGPVA